MGSEMAKEVRATNAILSEMLEEIRSQFNYLHKIRAFLEKWDRLWQQQAQNVDPSFAPPGMGPRQAPPGVESIEQWGHGHEQAQGPIVSAQNLVARPDYSPLPTGEVVCFVDCPQCHGRIRVDFGDEALMESAFMHAPKDPQTGGQI